MYSCIIKCLHFKHMVDIGGLVNYNSYFIYFAQQGYELALCIHKVINLFKILIVNDVRRNNNNSHVQ